MCLSLDVVRCNPASCRAVDNEVEKAIKDWFRFESDRDGGRQRRAAKKAAIYIQLWPHKTDFMLPIRHNTVA